MVVITNIPTENDAYRQIIDARVKKAVWPISLAANMLHPIYKGQKLSEIQSESALTFIMENLSQTGMQEFKLYQDNAGIFQMLFEKTDLHDPHVFWFLAKEYVPDLAKLSMQLLQIPGSTADLERLFSHWTFVHSAIRNRLSSFRSSKLVDVYYTLRHIDECISDEY